MEKDASPISQVGFDEAIPDTYHNYIDLAVIGLRQSA
jgi:hypothetical protein